MSIANDGWIRKMGGVLAFFVVCVGAPLIFRLVDDGAPLRS